MQLDSKHKFYCFVCILCTYPVGDFMDFFCDCILSFNYPIGRLPCKNFHLSNYVGVQKLYILENFIFWIAHQEQSTCTQITCSLPKRRLCRGF